jgi:hypothetical protein
MAPDREHNEDPFAGLDNIDFDPFRVDLHLTGNAFEDLLGRVPSDKEKIRLLRIQKTLGIPDEDSLWMILLALQYHVSLYEQVPGMVERAAKSGVSSAIEQIHSEAQKQLAKMRQRGEKERIRIYEDCSVSFHDLKTEALELIVQAVKSEVDRVSRRSPWAYFWISAASAGLVILGLAIGWVI